jgi:proline dehydrogenase
MEEKGLSNNHPKIVSSQLKGMSDNISFIMAKAGYNVQKYVPYGPVKQVIPYLIRRAQENTSVEGQTSREMELIVKEMKRRKIL